MYVGSKTSVWLACVHGFVRRVYFTSREPIEEVSMVFGAVGVLGGPTAAAVESLRATAAESFRGIDAAS